MKKILGLLLAAWTGVALALYPNQVKEAGIPLE